VRAGGDYWEQVEHYVAEHSDATFTHGICPTCYESVVAQIDAVGAKGVAEKARPVKVSRV
jgi:hypothetical protein